MSKKNKLMLTLKIIIIIAIIIAGNVAIQLGNLTFAIGFLSGMVYWILIDVVTWMFKY